MVHVHSFYLLGAVSFVHGVAAQDFPGPQPLSRLANGFIVEYADDPQTHSVVSPSYLMSEPRSVELGWAVLPLHIAFVLLLKVFCTQTAEQGGYGQSQRPCWCAVLRQLLMFDRMSYKE